MRRLKEERDAVPAREKPKSERANASKNEVVNEGSEDEKKKNEGDFASTGDPRSKRGSLFSFLFFISAKEQTR